MNFLSSELSDIPTQEIITDFLAKAGVRLFVKREDLIHPEVSGNKFRKLKYNLLEAQTKGFEQLLTFGGAYSNHIAATAAAGKSCGIQTIGMIRGEELGVDIEKTLRTNKTLRFAQEQGMELYFITRTQYRQKNTEDFLQDLTAEYGRFYHIPEGGTNALAIKGCKEILTKDDTVFDHVCCAVGTGGTISGIINSATKNQKILGFPALRGDFLKEEIEKYTSRSNWKLIDNYHFGGYGKVNEELVIFINEFSSSHRILLDPLYTGKMLYGIYDLIKSGYFPKKSRILAVHTGGLQGISGINQQLEKKKLPLIALDYD